MDYPHVKLIIHHNHTIVEEVEIIVNTRRFKFANPEVVLIRKWELPVVVVGVGVESLRKAACGGFEGSPARQSASARSGQSWVDSLFLP